ncbi:DUF3817 domain-containing protein [Methylobacterium iners]|uniref:DUF3817 domain-containing protein n=1 Tax=Methylobacterium iners TaxID=418707 RepID=UPI001EE38636|nr:DUF3817 domain-containing protein [Methylobacterium iners]
MALELAQLRRLELASLVEATTLILLIGVAVPLEHLAGQPLTVSILGPVHGLAFVIYAWAVVQTGTDSGWRASEWARLTVSAFVPFAGLTTRPLVRRKMAQLLENGSGAA